MAKPTEKAVNAATVIVTLNADVNKMAGVRNHRCGNWGVDPVAAIIDQKTGLPEITAERDRLRTEKGELLKELESLIEAIVEDWGWRERLRRLKRAEAALSWAEPESGEKEEPK